MDEKDLKPTDLDYAIASQQLQMLKVAIPYMNIPHQKTMALYIKIRELMRTMDFFDHNDEGMMSICSLDQEHSSPADMLEAIKPYVAPKEQEFVDLIEHLILSRAGRNNKNPWSVDQILSMLPPEQQARAETLQMVMQVLGQM